MRKYLIYAGIIIISVVVQSSTFLNSLKIGEIKPNILLILIIYFGLNKENITTQIISFSIGIFEDITSASILGINAFSKTLFGYIVSLTKYKIYSENLLSVSILVFFVTIAYGLTVLVLNSIFGSPLSIFHILLKIVLPEALYNCMISPLLFLLLNKIFSLTLR